MKRKKIKKWKVVVAPGAAIGIPKGDLKKVVKKMTAMANSGELIKKSKVVDMEKLKKEAPALYKILQWQLDNNLGRHDE